jgi:peptide/nickel transport system substrate-binding protein
MNEYYLQVASAKGDVFDNQKLREALSLSIDRDAIVSTLLNGYAIPARWPARKGDLGYVEKPATPITYNKAKAVQLVKESGYTGKEIDFIYTPGMATNSNELTQAIQSMAAEVGIKLKIRPLENAVYNDARAKHQFELVLAAIGYSGNAWYKTAHDVIGMDRFNTGVQNKKLKDLAMSLENIVDEAKAAAIYRQIYEIETTEFDPNIYLYWPSNIGAWDAKVTGVLWHFNQFPDLNSLVIKD